MDTIVMLNELSDYQAGRDVLALNKQELINKVMTPEIKAKIAEIEDEFSPQFEAIDKKIAEQTENIKTVVIARGETVKGDHLMAVFTKGRVSWDGKKLDGMMSLIPQLKDARKEGEPSVSLRKV